MIVKILVGLAAAAVLAGLAVFLLIRLSLKEPLQDLPVAEREWGKVAVLVAQTHLFELGKPGRAEFRLSVAAAEFVGRCPEAESDAPSHAATRSGAGLRVELRPALTGGRCGRRGFEGSSMPADPRRAELELPDLEKGPAKVVFVQGAREAVLVARADAGKVILEAASDPTGMLAPGNAAYKRLPRTMYLALGLSRETPELWGGNIPVEPADGKPLANDSLEAPVQYCRAPAPYQYAGGTATVDGKQVAYQQGVSELGLDALYEKLAVGEPGLVLYRLGLDGKLEKRP